MKTKQYLDLIVAFMDKHKWKEVEKVCHILIEKEPECAQAHFFIGIYYKHNKNIEAAKKAFYICLKHDINNFLSYINLIRILRDQNNFIEAFEIINKGKEIFPDKTLLYIESSEFYLKINNINEAIVDIQTAIKLDPKSETANYNYALIFNRLYNNAINDEEIEHYYRKTLIQYMNVLSINMFNTNVLCNYGSVNARYANRYNDKADRLFIESNELLIENRLIESKEKKEKANLYNMYAIQYNMEAETKYLQVIELDPLDHIAYFNLGLVSKSFHKFDKARYHFMKVIEINPSYMEAQIELKLLDEILNIK